LPTRANDEVNTIIPSNACGHKFNSTNRWNRPKTVTATKKKLDESSVVGITWCHGVNLRFLNIYGGGEGQSHSIALMEAVMHEVPHFAELKLCYDVAHIFEIALYRYNPDCMEVVEVQIGKFHIYGHQYRCHVLYNLLHTAHYGLMVGDEP
jgi:hypothetical protein